jgi:acyl carrier protein
MDGRLRQLLADVLQLPGDRITPVLAMKDVEVWDSLRHMELVAAIEKTFTLELTFEEIVAMQSVSAIETVLSARGMAP